MFQVIISFIINICYYIIYIIGSVDLADKYGNGTFILPVLFGHAY